MRSEFAEKTRKEIIENPAQLHNLFEDVFGEKSASYDRSLLVELVYKFKPDIIVDAINTATAISYQDVYISSIEVGNFLEQESKNSDAARDGIHLPWVMAQKINGLLVSQSIPQLIRHIQLLHDAMIKVGTRIYLKVGTTGTGGMGLNIPYTHSEDKPSAKLMSKTAVAFAHTGLLFLMARTPESPIVKEIKPGAMIGYADVAHRAITHKASGTTTGIFTNCAETLSGTLILRDDSNGRYQRVGDMALPVVDTGENGLFTKGEFEAITSLRRIILPSARVNSSVSPNLLVTIDNSSPPWTVP